MSMHRRWGITRLERSRCHPILPLLALTLMALGACASPGKYEISVRPGSPPDRFVNIEVVPVTTSITSEPLDVSAPAMLRSAVIAALEKTGRYESVASEIEPGPGLLRITCRIDEFETVSGVSQFFLGRFAGKSHLDATCRFEDGESDQLYAEGVFTGESDGLENMIEDAAAALARFLDEES